MSEQDTSLLCCEACISPFVFTEEHDPHPHVSFEVKPCRDKRTLFKAP